MSKITNDNLVMKLEAAAINAARRGFSGELYQAAALRILALERGDGDEVCSVCGHGRQERRWA